MEAQGLKFSKKGKLSNQAENFQIIPQKELPQTCLGINSLIDTKLLCVGSSDHKKTRKTWTVWEDPGPANGGTELTLPEHEQEQLPHLKDQER